jgi:hypothetical protein
MTLNKWKKITKRSKPPEGVPCFFYEPATEERTERIWVGAFEYSADAEGWFYGNADGDFYWSHVLQEWVLNDNEWDDDYKPTRWMALPDPPKP